MKKVHATDHALLRYLERVRGIDVEAIRAHIEKTCEGAAAMGASYVHTEGVKFAIVNHNVTTVIPNTKVPTATHVRRMGLKPA